MGILRDGSNQRLQAEDGKFLLDTSPVPGSAQDFADRLRNLLPAGWFPNAPQDGEQEQAPVLAAILLGMGSILAGSWTLMQQAEAQMRLTTMSGSFLDMASQDYLGNGVLPRGINESDLRYRNRILQSLMAPRNTRAAVLEAIRRITGYAPTVIEPTNAADCHAYGSAAVPAVGGGYGYGATGLRYGSTQGGLFFIETVAGGSSSRSAIFQAVSQSAALGVVGWVRVEE